MCQGPPLSGPPLHIPLATTVQLQVAGVTHGWLRGWAWPEGVKLQSRQSRGTVEKSESEQSVEQTVCDVLRSSRLEDIVEDLEEREVDWQEGRVTIVGLLFQFLLSFYYCH